MVLVCRAGTTVQGGLFHHGWQRETRRCPCHQDTAEEDDACLLRFNGELGTVPLVPAALERIQVGKAPLGELLCRPGTGKFVRSGTVEDERGLLGIFVGQGQDVGRLDADRPLDF